jgi:hypothetical protein
MNGIYGVFKKFPINVSYGFDGESNIKENTSFVMVGDDLEKVKKFCLDENQRYFSFDKEKYSHFDDMGVYPKEGKIEMKGYFYLPLQMWKFDDDHVDYETGLRYYDV